MEVDRVLQRGCLRQCARAVEVVVKVDESRAGIIAERSGTMRGGGDWIGYQRRRKQSGYHRRKPQDNLAGRWYEAATRVDESRARVTGGGRDNAEGRWYRRPWK